MSEIATAVPEPIDDEDGAGAVGGSVTLKGGGRGLEILVSGTPTLEALTQQLTELLSAAPSFFAGNRARVVVDGVLPQGALGRLEEVATRFDLRLFEVGPIGPKRTGPEPGPVGSMTRGRTPRDLAMGSGDTMLAAVSSPVPVPIPAPEPPAIEPPSVEIEIIAEPEPEPEDDHKPRTVVGPVRSGVILEHRGDIIVIGDVNPGAEIRTEGNIVVLGRMRGVAHAGIGREAGFILALTLQPQQLRIGRRVACAGDAKQVPDGAEIAFITGETIVVERFCGRLPSGLAATL
jgi:septum formation inhibitor MinC